MNNLWQLAEAQGKRSITDYCGFCFGGTNGSLGGLIGSLLPAVFSIAGVLLVFYTLWGGFKWITSGGDKEKVASAQQMIIHAVYGLGLLVLVFILFKFIPEFFGASFNIFG